MPVTKADIARARRRRRDGAAILHTDQGASAGRGRFVGRVSCPGNRRGERLTARPDVVHLSFLAPRETGLTAPEFAVARTFGFSCLGFFASLLPRLLSPLPIMVSQVENTRPRHAERAVPRGHQGCLTSVRAVIAGELQLRLVGHPATLRTYDRAHLPASEATRRSRNISASSAWRRHRE